MIPAAHLIDLLGCAISLAQPTASDENIGAPRAFEMTACTVKPCPDQILGIDARLKNVVHLTFDEANPEMSRMRLCISSATSVAVIASSIAVGVMLIPYCSCKC